MKKLALAMIGAVALTQAAGAQEAEGEAYCTHLLSEIAIMQQSVNGLSSLLNSNSYALVPCDIDRSLPSTLSRDQCLASADVLGHWVDYETQVFYVVYSKDFVRSYAQNIGASPSALQNSFDASDRASEKIRWGEVIPSLQVEIADWQAEYARSCGSAPVQDNSGNGCLLGVCP